MKTVTEFSGFSLRNLHTLRADLIRKKRDELKAAAALAPAEPPVAEPGVEAVPKELPEELPKEFKEEVNPTTESPVLASQPVEEAAPVEAVAPAPVAEAAKGQIIIKPRGDGPAAGKSPIKVGNQSREEWKKAEEMAAEEFSQKVAAELKLEGEKLEHAIHALQVVDPKRAVDLRRVVIFTAAEGEKVSSEAKKVGEHYYLAEYLASLNPEKPKGRFARNDRGARGGRPGRGDGKGKKPRGNGRPPRSRDGESRPNAFAPQNQNPGAPREGAPSDRPKREFRPRRPNLKPQARPSGPPVPSGNPSPIKPVST